MKRVPYPLATEDFLFISVERLPNNLFQRRRDFCRRSVASSSRLLSTLSQGISCIIAAMNLYHPIVEQFEHNARGAGSGLISFPHAQHVVLHSRPHRAQRLSSAFRGICPNLKHNILIFNRSNILYIIAAIAGVLYSFERYTSVSVAAGTA